MLMIKVGHPLSYLSSPTNCNSLGIVISFCMYGAVDCISLAGKAETYCLPNLSVHIHGSLQCHHTQPTKQPTNLCVCVILKVIHTGGWLGLARETRYHMTTKKLSDNSISWLQHCQSKGEIPELSDYLHHNRMFSYCSHALFSCWLDH